MPQKDGFPVIALIPARAGSKGVRDKNTRRLAGKPLYLHSVNQAIEAGIEQVFISTNIPEIIRAKLPDFARIVKRPDELSTDSMPMAPVITDFLSRIYTAPANVVLLQPTSPLRTSAQIKDALELFCAGGCSSVMSVCPTMNSVLKYGTIDNGEFNAMRNNADCFANRQTLRSVYRPNGAIYVFDADEFRRSAAFPIQNIKPLVMNEDTSVDIDSIEDFEICERILNERAQQNENRKPRD